MSSNATYCSQIEKKRKNVIILKKVVILKIQILFLGIVRKKEPISERTYEIELKNYQILLIKYLNDLVPLSMPKIESINKRSFCLKRKGRLNKSGIKIFEDNYKIIRAIRKRKNIDSDEILSESFNKQVQLNPETEAEPPDNEKLGISDFLDFSSPICTSTPKHKRNETAVSDHDLFAGCQSQLTQETPVEIPNTNSQKDPVEAPKEDEILWKLSKKVGRKATKNKDSKQGDKKPKKQKTEHVKIVKDDHAAVQINGQTSPKTLEKFQRIQKETRSFLERLESEEYLQHHTESGYSTFFSDVPSTSSSNQTDLSDKMQEIVLNEAHMQEISKKLKISTKKFQNIVKSVVTQD